MIQLVNPLLMRILFLYLVPWYIRHDMFLNIIYSEQHINIRVVGDLDLKLDIHGNDGTIVEWSVTQRDQGDESISFKPNTSVIAIIKKVESNKKKEIQNNSGEERPIQAKTIS